MWGHICLHFGNWPNSKNFDFAWDVLQILQLPDMQESVSPATFFSFLDPNWVPIGSRLEPIWSTWRLFEGPWGSPEQFWVSF